MEVCNKTEVQVLSQHIKELTELKEPELMDWEPTSQLTVPDFEQMIDEKIRKELYPSAKKRFFRNFYRF